MTTSQGLCDLLKSKGFDFYTGVPDSTFEGVFSLLESDPSVAYVSAVREDAAIGMAVGAYLSGRRPLVLMQNSGLGLSINALASLAVLYKTEMLLLIGWRGYQGKDAPEHLIMGECTPDLLRDVGVPYEVLEPNGVAEGLQRAVDAMEAGRTPAALIIRPGVLE
jgi:sulfopyruvate decarboxylase alpha subunit